MQLPIRGTNYGLARPQSCAAEGTSRIFATGSGYGTIKAPGAAVMGSVNRFVYWDDCVPWS